MQHFDQLICKQKPNIKIGELLIFHIIHLNENIKLHFPDKTLINFNKININDTSKYNGDLPDFDTSIEAIKKIKKNTKNASERLMKWPGHGCNISCVGGTYSLNVNKQTVSFICKQYLENDNFRHYLLMFLY